MTVKGNLSLTLITRLLKVKFVKQPVWLHLQGDEAMNVRNLELLYSSLQGNDISIENVLARCPMPLASIPHLESCRGDPLRSPFGGEG